MRFSSLRSSTSRLMTQQSVLLFSLSRVFNDRVVLSPDKFSCSASSSEANDAFKPLSNNA